MVWVKLHFNFKAEWMDELFDASLLSLWLDCVTGSRIAVALQKLSSSQGFKILRRSTRPQNSLGIPCRHRSRRLMTVFATVSRWGNWSEGEDKGNLGGSLLLTQVPFGFICNSVNSQCCSISPPCWRQAFAPSHARCQRESHHTRRG